MSKVEYLLHNFETVMQESWTGVLSLEERMYFLVYDPAEQRKVDLHLSDFENITSKSGKKWIHISLEGLFSEWMAQNEYRDAYFEDPEALVDQLEGVFKDYILDYLKEKISSAPQEKDVLIAITQITALFGFCRLSDILNSLQTNFPGRILLFFPGEFEKNHYRLLDARDGWNYLARPITI
ncbi:MAG: BREX protein BrxB domain-containing protein [Salibacteraceae bacterium]